MSNPVFYLLFGLLVVWVGSYFYSIQHNRQKLRWLAEWLREALPVLGTDTSSQWHGADRLDVLIAKGRPPLREAAIVLGLQSRQFFRLLTSLLRGGRDSLSFLVSLQNTPAAGTEFEIFEATGPLPSNVITAAGTVHAWEVETHVSGYRIAFHTPAAYQSAQRVLTLLLDERYNLRRLSVRSAAPHLFLILNLGQLPQVEAAGLLRLLRSLAEEVSPKAPETRPARPSRKANPPKPPTPSNRFGPGLTLPHSSNGHSADSGLPD